MDSNNKTNDDNKKENGFSMTIKIPDSVNMMKNLAEKIKIAIPDADILTNFMSMVDSQKNVLSSASKVLERFKIESDKIDAIMRKTLLPLEKVVNDMNSLNERAVELLNIDTISKEQLCWIQDISQSSINVLQKQQELISNNIESAGVGDFLQSEKIALSALHAVTSGINEMIRSLPTFPTDNLNLNIDNLSSNFIPPFEIENISDEEIAEYQDELDELLNKIDPSLIDSRKGAWESFNNKGHDYVRQASASMRGVVDGVLRALAPIDKVANSDFFKSNQRNFRDNNDRPNRKARVLYIIKWDGNEAKHLKRFARSFLEDYDNLSAWDHLPLNKDGFVHGRLIAIEGHLLTLLSANRE